MKEIGDDMNTWKDISNDIEIGLEEWILLKWPHYPKQSSYPIQFLAKYPSYCSLNYNK